MTVGILNGHNLRWFNGGVVVLKSTTGEISFNKELRATTHKDNTGSWATKSGSTKSFSGSCTAYMAEGETFEAFWATFDASGTSELLTMQFSTDVVGDKEFTCTVIITSMKINADDDEDVTYDVSFEGTGAPTRVVKV